MQAKLFELIVTLQLIVTILQYSSLDFLFDALKKTKIGNGLFAEVLTSSVDYGSERTLNHCPLMLESPYMCKKHPLSQ